MEIIVGFSKNKNPLKIGSLFIQLAEKRNFSHAYFRYKCPLTELNIVNQASLGRVNEMTFETFKKENIIIEEYVLKLSNAEFNAILLFLKLNLGVKYSQIQIILIGMLKLLGIKKLLKINGTNQYICSEYVGNGLRMISYITSNVPKELDTYTPSDLREIIKSGCINHKNRMWQVYG